MWHVGGTRGKRSTFGTIRKLPSGRYQARYTDPEGAKHAAPVTFDAKIDAEGWLSTIRADIVRGVWNPPTTVAPPAVVTFAGYAATWLAQRDVTPRTREHYSKLLDRQILPAFREMPVHILSPAAVREWYSRLDAGTPTTRAHAYALLKAICATAVDDDLLVANPCRIRGAGQAKRVSKTEPASVDELAVLVAAMPQRYRLMTLLAAWCGLRFGELTELRRKDIDTKAGTIKVRRAVVHVGTKAVVSALETEGAAPSPKTEAIVSTPKTEAGVRDVSIPPHLMPAVRAHL
ncbi:MAG: integrase family protein, partial [Jatrophihabitantaceae bacterium]|nr:integrase family protein [Jatrophihabitantaceae bacterium]